MPWPVRLNRTGGTLTLPDPVPIRSRAADPLAGRTVEVFAARLQSVTGLRVTVSDGDALIEFETGGTGHEEAYSLTVTPARVLIRGVTPAGLSRGAETLLQLVAGHALPLVEIDDAPRYSWRGVLLDPARHFLPPEVVKRFVGCMAAMKLNVLHWHLSDDQGFRMESRRFPLLHQRGSEGRFYRQDEVRELISFASDHGVRVVPEFDVPGHTTSWLVGYPNLGSLPGDENANGRRTYELRRGWGVSNFALDPTREEVYTFLEQFIEEMCSVFPDPCFHIGGDEVLPVAWTSNSRITEWMSERGMEHTRDLQVLFNRRLSEILKRCGKRLVGWDEVLHQDLPADALVQSWRGHVFFAQALERHQAILSSGYYLDQLLPASYHYGIDPEEHELTAEQKANIAGGEGCLWGEYIDPANLESRAWPRLCAVAERLWSTPDLCDTREMYERLAFASAHLERVGSRHGVNYRAMLERLVGDSGAGALEALMVLAAVVEPVKFYDRALARLDSSHTPLNRLVDAVHPESDAARMFAEEVESFRIHGRESDRLRETMLGWRDHRHALEPAIKSSPLLSEIDPLSRNLSHAARAGVEALEFIESGGTPPQRWWLSSVSTIERAKAPRAELVLVVLPAIRQLVNLAAARG